MYFLTFVVMYFLFQKMKLCENKFIFDNTIPKFHLQATGVQNF